MFNKSRRKIIFSIMGSLILLFVVTLSVIMFASYMEVRQKNSELLERYVELFRLDSYQKPDDQKPDGQRPGDAPEIPEQMMQQDPGAKKDNPPIEERSDYKLSTFYSVAISDDGTVREVDDGDRSVYEEEELVEIARQLIGQEKNSGTSGNLDYMISSGPGYTLVAFLDNTVAESSLDTLLGNILLVGGIALVVLFFISLFLARWIIRPLEENDRKQKQFISDASHELKTPVAVIGANSEMLSREIGVNEWLGNIRYENERMGALITQLLELSRAESAAISMEQVDLSRVVTGEAMAFDSLAFERGKTINSDIEDGINVTGSMTQLQQLASILIDNALRHSTGTEIGLRLKKHGRSAVLTVENDADEIPPEKQKHLFDRFYRVDEARNSESGHYGLGLSIAKAVAERHKGNIAVSCRDGKVCFSVVLPL